MSLVEQDITTQLFSLEGKWLEGKCVKCYDADSVHIVFKLFDEFARFKCRLCGIDTPELRTNNVLERQVAKDARDYLRSLILDKIIFVNCHEFDKYGRLLVTIHISASKLCSESKVRDSVQSKMCHVSTFKAPAFVNSINNHLIQKGYAYAYDGDTKKKRFNEWYNKKNTDV